MMQGFPTSLILYIAVLCFCDKAQGHKTYDWWQQSIVYQIYPLSFKDSNGDGYGDINGIFEKLDYIKDIGVDIIWIQPFYKSPMLDLGYDVSDYRAVDSLFGTLDDFKNLVRRTHEKGMKLIMDFVPNHSSDQCEWFKLALQGVAPYKDYYTFKDAKKINETHFTYPNNWRSIFGGGSAWTWSEEREQYFYHMFSVKQPEFDLRNPSLLREFESVMRFWLDMGVDGFRIDATLFLLEAAHFKDEPAIVGSKNENAFFNLDHIYTLDQPGNYDLVKSWGSLLQEYKKKDGHTRLTCPEDYGAPETLKQYLGNETHPGAQIAFYNRIVYLLSSNTNSSGVEQWVRRMIDNFPEGYYNWLMENHDNSRVSSRFNPESVDSWNTFTLLLPGIATIYYGGELGLEDIKPRPDQKRDPNNIANPHSMVSRDASRGPMLWDDTLNAGFTKAEKPWLPVNPNYYRMNVNAQRANPNSHLNIFKRLVQLRKTPVIRYGDLQTFVPKEWIFMFTRSVETETVAVVMNIGSETEEVCAQNSATTLPDTMFVYTSSMHSGFSVGSEVKISDSDGTACVTLRPFSTLVLSTNRNIPQLNSSSIISSSILIWLITSFFRLIW